LTLALRASVGALLDTVFRRLTADGVDQLTEG